MRRIINILGFISAIVTTVVIVATFLTSYRFIYINEIFSGYYPIQLTIMVTMLIWAIRFWLNNSGKRKYIYTMICLMLSIVSFIFANSSIVK
ncbi:hypothetical protein [Clostridium paridis]|uniref:Uncharacterized protein n=1 Tax=Clostridium paridis TaxID=2803863 RepID=A0A937K4H5_9CLOT|nr:hypothetical protein [Clostridium paridis]MBL4933341.1 hypothetical protein [Clostridium paridis]